MIKTKKFVTVEELKELYILNDDSSKDEIKVQDNLHKALVQLGFVTNPAVNNDLANVDWTKVENELKTNIELWETKVFNSKLTSTYTNGKVTTLIKDNAKIEIYDGIIRAIYNQSATLEAKGSNKEGDVIASFTIKVKDNDKFNDFTITVEDLYTLLEGSIGVTATIDEIVNKLLIQEYNKKDGMFSKLTKEQLDPSEFNKDYKTLIKNFSADQFAQAGYPSSMGRESFLLLMFGTTDKAEAIEKGFLIPQLRTLYTSGFDIVRDTEFDIYQFS